MTKTELVNDLKRSCGGSGFITRKQVSDYFGNACPKSIDRYLRGLERVNEKYFFIPDVADNIIRYKGGIKA